MSFPRIDPDLEIERMYFGTNSREIFSKKQEILDSFCRFYLEKRKILDLSFSTIRRPLPLEFATELCARIMKMTEVGAIGNFGYPDPNGIPRLRHAVKAAYYNQMEFIQAADICIVAGSQNAIYALSSFMGRNPSALNIGFFSPTYPAFPLALQAAGFVLQDPAGPSGNHKMVAIHYTRTTDIISRIDAAQPLNALYLSNPNNPTGEFIPKNMIERLIDYAVDRSMLVIYDCAYSNFVRPQNYFEVLDIPKANMCVVELNSFSKTAGLAAARLGWLTIPSRTLLGSILKWFDVEEWKNQYAEAMLGVSTFSQIAAETFLSGAGTATFKQYHAEYLAGSRALKSLLLKEGYFPLGGEDCPLVWVENKSSFVLFGTVVDLLKHHCISGSPGVAYRFHADEPIDACRLSTMCTSAELDRVFSLTPRKGGHANLDRRSQESCI